MRKPLRQMKKLDKYTKTFSKLDISESMRNSLPKLKKVFPKLIEEKYRRFVLEPRG